MTDAEKPAAGTTWRLWRQDDHGNVVVVRDYATAEEAEQVRDVMEAKGHHQTYWVERVTSGSPEEDPSG